MKRGGPQHPKTLTLAAKLEIERWGAVGIVESLCHFAMQYARRGDIGRHPDAAIAEGIGWRGEPEKLISGLVEAGFLDRCPCHRLRIHDWPHHADQALQKTRDVVTLGFLECYESHPNGYPEDSTGISVYTPVPVPVPVKVPVKGGVGGKTPTVHEALPRFVEVFNRVFSRRVTPTIALDRPFRARLRDGYAVDDLLALPILAEAQGWQDQQQRAHLQVDWLLRDGTGRYTGQDGMTRNTRNWIGDLLSRADETTVKGPLVDLVREFGLQETFKRLQVKRRVEASSAVTA